MDDSDHSYESDGDGSAQHPRAKKTRVSKACDQCKASRRKCSGVSPCEHCTKRSIQCSFDSAPNKKRGPKSAVRQQMLEDENAALRAELELLRSQAAAAGAHSLPASRLQSLSATAAAPSPTPAPSPMDALLPAGVWGIPGPIIPSPEEAAILRAYFTFTNRTLPACDEEYFYAALEAARYIPVQSGVVASYNGAERLNSFPAPQSSSSSSSTPSVFGVARNSEMFGFRVCYYTLLCIGARMMNQCAAARQYYELARAFIGPCFTQPSQHLVSALLVMTMITRAMCPDSTQPALHAALALRMSEVVEVNPEVKIVAVMFNHAHTAGGAAAIWPPTVAPPGVPAHMRFAEIMGFVILQLKSDFPLVPAEPLRSPGTSAAAAAGASAAAAAVAAAAGARSWPADPRRSHREAMYALLDATDPLRFPREAMFALLDEALALQTSHKLFLGFPLRAVTWGIRGLLLQRSGPEHHCASMQAAKEAIDAAAADKLALFSFPCVLVIAKLLGMVKRIAVQSFWLPRDAPLDAAAAAAAAPQQAAGGAAAAAAGSSGAEGIPSAAASSALVPCVAGAANSAPRSHPSSSSSARADSPSAVVVDDAAAAAAAAAVAVEGGVAPQGQQPLAFNQTLIPLQQQGQQPAPSSSVSVSSGSGNAEAPSDGPCGGPAKKEAMARALIQSACAFLVESKRITNGVLCPTKFPGGVRSGLCGGGGDEGGIHHDVAAALCELERGCGGGGGEACDEDDGGCGSSSASSSTSERCGGGGLAICSCDNPETCQCNAAPSSPSASFKAPSLQYSTNASASAAAAAAGECVGSVDDDGGGKLELAFASLLNKRGSVVSNPMQGAGQSAAAAAWSVASPASSSAALTLGGTSATASASAAASSGGGRGGRRTAVRGGGAAGAPPSSSFSSSSSSSSVGVKRPSYADFPPSSAASRGASNAVTIANILQMSAAVAPKARRTASRTSASSSAGAAAGREAEAERLLAEQEAQRRARRTQRQDHYMEPMLAGEHSDVQGGDGLYADYMHRAAAAAAAQPTTSAASGAAGAVSAASSAPRLIPGLMAMESFTQSERGSEDDAHQHQQQRSMLPSIYPQQYQQQHQQQQLNQQRQYLQQPSAAAALKQQQQQQSFGLGSPSTSTAPPPLKFNFDGGAAPPSPSNDYAAMVDSVFAESLTIEFDRVIGGSDDSMGSNTRSSSSSPLSTGGGSGGGSANGGSANRAHAATAPSPSFFFDGRSARPPGGHVVLPLPAPSSLLWREQSGGAHASSGSVLSSNFNLGAMEGVTAQRQQQPHARFLSGGGGGLVSPTPSSAAFQLSLSDGGGGLLAAANDVLASQPDGGSGGGADEDNSDAVSVTSMGMSMNLASLEALMGTFPINVATLSAY